MDSIEVKELEQLLIAEENRALRDAKRKLSIRDELDEFKRRHGRKRFDRVSDHNIHLKRKHNKISPAYNRLIRDTKRQQNVISAEARNKVYWGIGISIGVLVLL